MNWMEDMKKPCPRCSGTDQARIMSKFNTEMICMDCKDRERKHPKYAEADAAEIAAVRSGMSNFAGVGCPPDLYLANQPIISARITAMPQGLTDPMPEVYVKVKGFEDHEVFLFQFYPDEISFTPKEFVGRTVGQAKQIKFEKDKKYLQS